MELRQKVQKGRYPSGFARWPPVLFQPQFRRFTLQECLEEEERRKIIELWNTYQRILDEGKCLYSVPQEINRTGNIFGKSY